MACICVFMYVCLICACQFRLPTNSDTVKPRFHAEQLPILNINHMKFANSIMSDFRNIFFMDLMKILFILSVFILVFFLEIFFAYYFLLCCRNSSNSNMLWFWKKKSLLLLSVIINSCDEDFIKFNCLAYVCHVLDTILKVKKNARRAARKWKLISLYNKIQIVLEWSLNLFELTSVSVVSSVYSNFLTLKAKVHGLFAEISCKSWTSKSEHI